jgi:predicted membrane-bound spermidine synthase
VDGPPQHDSVDPTPGEARRPRGLRRAGLFVLAFSSGFAVLTIEIAGARLIAPVFGLSAVPWTAVIGVILGALALGSHYGGRLADAGRVPLSLVLVVAALTAALPVVGGGVPWLARAAFGFIGGAVASAAVLFAPSVLCLGAVVPYLVQADTESLGSVGRRAGDVSAMATAGSIVGSFATGFVLLPLLPLPMLLGLTAVALLLLAALSGWILGGRIRTGPVAAVAAGVIVLVGAASRLPEDTLHAEQTLYASVAVTEREWADGSRVRELWQNGGTSSAEYVESGEPAHDYAVRSLELLAPVLEDLESALVLGGAALTLPVALEGRNPGLRVDVVEIDPVVTDLARRYFAYGKRAHPGIRVVHQDARVFLEEPGRRYDLVYLDVFDHLLTVPWTMITQEALGDMAARMEPGGLFMANVLAPTTGPGAPLLRRMLATVEAVFEEVRVYTAQPDADPSAIRNLLVVAGADPSRLATMEPSGIRVRGEGPPLTDAWAPVEYLQAKVFLGGLRWR